MNGKHRRLTPDGISLTKKKKKQTGCHPKFITAFRCATVKLVSAWNWFLEGTKRVAERSGMRETNFFWRDLIKFYPKQFVNLFKKKGFWYAILFRAATPVTTLTTYILFKRKPYLVWICYKGTGRQYRLNHKALLANEQIFPSTKQIHSAMAYQDINTRHPSGFQS